MSGPLAASCCCGGLAQAAVDVFFRRIIGVRRRTAQLELLAAVDTHAVRRLVLVRLDLGVQTHLAVFVRRRGGVLRAERIVDDFVAGEQRVVLTLRPDTAAVPTDVVGLLHRREQLQRALRRKMRADGPVIWNTIPVRGRSKKRRPNQKGRLKERA